MTDEAERPSVLTVELTTDQRGWAKERYNQHYRTNGARWYISTEKPAIPIPAPFTNKPRRRKHA